MADAEFTIWQGTLLPSIGTTLIGAGKKAVDLTNASVFFRLLKDGVLIFEAPAVVNDPDPTTGRARYDWQSGDTDRHGMFDAQWRVVVNGKSMITPVLRFNRVRIQPLAA